MDTVNGARIIVTGPTSGIGKEIASQLASCGAEVILACRDAERGAQVATEIIPNAQPQPNLRSSPLIHPARPRSESSLASTNSAMPAWTCS
jgi:NAD(P)-dependent dehydrogenase (short-subunit alcohol dehydrogenase family)